MDDSLTRNKIFVKQNWNLVIACILWKSCKLSSHFVELQHLKIDRKTGRIKRRVVDPFRFL
ncbi:hypothetical protein T01_14162 [Trichinella spiralis]|uniref:Uncharacterized protein n=1 Tax=Trichinella spiralis TaxID=6334 RepID=A0A0V1AYJ1_TRISP|nr:hypothetical protein T01_14162 [Trichinella spiralis]